MLAFASTKSEIKNQLQPGQFFFRTLREIGRGGLGVVSEIEITETNQSYPVGTRLAQKKLNEHWSRNPTMLKRFEREIDTLKRMDHPYILRIKGENLSGGERFYCMDVYKGSLRHWIAAQSRQPTVREVAAHFATIADALAHAHALGNIHRDIKPENILHTQDHRPIVADWGLGYFVHQNSVVLTKLTRGGMGTEYYCSAEQWSTGKCGPEGDVYSLGVTMAEALTCKQNRMPLIGAGISTDIVPTVDQASGTINSLIKAMTKQRANQRIQSMTQIRDILHAITHSSS